MYIEGIVLERFSALPQIKINSSTKPCPRHAVFHYCFSDDSKQYAATTSANIKHLIEMLKEKKLLTSTLSTIWENTDGFAEQYRLTGDSIDRKSVVSVYELINTINHLFAMASFNYTSINYD